MPTLVFEFEADLPNAAAFALVDSYQSIND